jgi:hypothetical protein
MNASIERSTTVKRISREVALFPWYTRALLILLALYTAVVTAYSLTESAKDVTNEMRAAPTLAVFHGVRIYQRNHQGISFSILYGPISYLLHLPAALCSGPRSFFLTGCAISLVLFCVPLFLFLRRLQMHSANVFWTGLLFAVLFILVTNNSVSLRLSAMLISPDAAALGLSGAACTVLFFYSGKRPWLDPCLMAGFTCCALFSKQNMVALAVILPLFSLLIGGRQLALRLIVCMGAGALITLAIVFAVYHDLVAVYFNNVIVPGRFLRRWDHAPGAVRLLYEQGVLLLFAIGCLVFVSCVGTDSVVRRLGRGDLSRTLLFACMAVGSVPASIMGSVFWGGWLNPLSPTLYFELLTLVALSHLLLVEVPAEAGVRSGVLGVLLIFAVVLTPLAAERVDRTAFLRRSASDVVYRYALQHPGQVYFPFNQVSVYFAEHRFYHADWGIMNYDSARLPYSGDEIRRGVPPTARFIAYPSAPTKMLMAPYLSPGRRRAQLPGLEEFSVVELER